MSKFLISVAAVALLSACAAQDARPAKLVAAVEPASPPSTSGPAPSALAPSQRATPLFPILVHAPNNGPTIAQINADGTVTGDKMALTALLNGMTGQPTPESVIFALINHLMFDPSAPVPTNFPAFFPIGDPRDVRSTPAAAIPAPAPK